MRASFQIYKHEDGILGSEWERVGMAEVEGTPKDVEDIRKALIFSTKEGTSWLVK